MLSEWLTIIVLGVALLICFCVLVYDVYKRGQRRRSTELAVLREGLYQLKRNERELRALTERLKDLQTRGNEH